MTKLAEDKFIPFEPSKDGLPSKDFIQSVIDVLSKSDNFIIIGDFKVEGNKTERQGFTMFNAANDENLICAVATSMKLNDDARVVVGNAAINVFESEDKEQKKAVFLGKGGQA